MRWVDFEATTGTSPDHKSSTATKFCEDAEVELTAVTPDARRRVVWAMGVWRGGDASPCLGCRSRAAVQAPPAKGT
ncbi:MAG: hypothetical protein M3256_24450, partial [Actinomycetota bacterium]|nr:hypothetical protein [Actinomycetota bacterium]